ncbi:MAG: hypothetical protein ABFC98_08055 [Candidatus Cloacimonas sp.]
MVCLKPCLRTMMCVITILMLISGCTDKKNLTGDNFSDVSAITVNDESGIMNGYSFPAEKLATISGSETKLLAGSYQNATAISFLRFTGLPEDMINIRPDSCFLQVKISKRSALPRNPLKLKLYKLNKVWSDSIDLEAITNSDLSQNPLAEWTVADTIGSTGKVVKFALPTSEIFNWETPDTLGWNFVLKTENDGWVEIISSEQSTGPKLNLNYQTEVEGEYETYNEFPAKDTYTLNAPVGVTSESWKISNLTSTRMYLLYEPTYTIFKDNEGNMLDSLQIKRMTINKAVIVLHIKQNDYYSGTNSYSLYSFNVVKDSITDMIPLVTGDYEIISNTVTSTGYVSSDSITVDITPIMQAYSSADKKPKGIMIQSLQERQNFGTVEFWDCKDSTPAGKKPYIKITYTPPYL